MAFVGFKFKWLSVGYGRGSLHRQTYQISNSSLDNLTASLNILHGQRLAFDWARLSPAPLFLSACSALLSLVHRVLCWPGRVLLNIRNDLLPYIHFDKWNTVLEERTAHPQSHLMGHYWMQNPSFPFATNLT